MSLRSLSVFLPAYNEEKNIIPTIENVVNGIKDLNLEEWEVLVINDGSKDETALRVEELHKRFPRVKLIGYETNRGYGHALKTGFESSQYDWVAFLDSDGQFKFEEIKKLLEHVDSADVILGYRLNRADPFQRRIFTWGWKMLALVILGLNVRDYSCGFKMMKKKVYQDIKPIESEEKVTQIEMLIKAKKRGYKFAEVGVRHYRRIHGVPTGANLKVVLKSFGDMIRLWYKINFLKW
jgi:glycosyltransferase involved in cell wall biosynthesis